MRGCVAALLLLLALPSFPQCNLTPVASAQFRGTIFDLAATNGRLWAATAYGVTLYDTTVDPPAVLDSVALPGSTRVVRASGNIGYAASGSAIQVVRWTGSDLQFAGSVDAGAPVNELLLTTNFLYVATANGLAQYDLLNPTAPVKTSATFATSSANVGALALSGDTIYATDGDTSIEVFSVAIPTLPQKSGTVTTALPRPTGVNAANGLVYVTDGQQTEVFVGSNVSLTSAAVLPFGSISFASLSTTAILAAGNDRRLRAFDVSSAAAPVEILSNELAATSGTVNRINSIVLAGGRLYAGAGDIGLVTYDMRQFVAPFPMRSYATIATSSVSATANGRAYFGRGAGVVEYTQSSTTGGLTEARSWDKSHADVVQDAEGDFVLTSFGSSATLWVLSAAQPTLIGTATFRAPVLQAVLTGTKALAVLNDRTLWSADLSQAAATPQQIQLTLAPQFIARSGSNVVLADLRGDGTTTVAMLNAAASAVAASASVPGLATAGVALSGTTAVTWTFRGLTLIDFPSGATTLLPQSNTVAAADLALNGTRLVEMTGAAVIVWDTASQRVTAQYALPSTPGAVVISPNGLFADFATADGVAVIQLAGTSRMPALIPAANANFYAKKLVTNANRVLLFDGRNTDIFSTSLEYRGGIHDAGAIDVAANDTAVFTLTNTLSVAAYTRDGAPLGSTILVESADAQPLSIAAMSGAAWASIVRGCPLNCEKKTIVFDARGASPAQTATMTGAVRDLAVSGTRAYVLTELPDEIRIFDISDPAHPRQLAARPSEGVRLPTAISYANGVVYVLGEKLFEYDDTLSKVGEAFRSYVDDPTIGVTYADQRVRVDGGCVAVTGRDFSPQLYDTAMVPLKSFTTPSAARAITAQPGRLYVLTDHSLEVWAGAALPVPARRRP